MTNPPKITEEEAARLHYLRKHMHMMIQLGQMRSAIDSDGGMELIESAKPYAEEGYKLFCDLIHKYIGPDADPQKYHIEELEIKPLLEEDKK